MGMTFRLLGPVEVIVDGIPLPMPAGKLPTLLAGLLLRANHIVPVTQLARWLWDEEDSDPNRARATVQEYVRRLRRTIGSDDVIHTADGGYRIDAGEDSLDLLRFHPLAARGRSAAEAAVAELPAVSVRATLTRLVTVHLMEQDRPRRYRFHDLMRRFAADLTERFDGRNNVEQATRRLLDWYLYSVVNADIQLSPQLALAAARRLGDLKGEAHALNGLGIALIRSRREGAAIAHFFEALPMWQRLGDRRGEFVVRINLTVTHTLLGEFSDAVEHGIEALRIARAMNSLPAQLNGLLALARAYTKNSSSKH